MVPVSSGARDTVLRPARARSLRDSARAVRTADPARPAAVTAAQPQVRDVMTK